MYKLGPRPRPLPVPQLAPLSSSCREASPPPLTQPSQILRHQFSFPEADDQLHAETCSKITERVEKRCVGTEREKRKTIGSCHLAMNLPKQSLQVFRGSGVGEGALYRADFKNNFSSYSLHVHWGRFCCSKNKKPMSDTSSQIAPRLLRNGTLFKRECLDTVD